ncbi:MAG: hypothetical protein K5685_03565 [Bacteroidales bacterium]|jgi:rubrerythrin|nr:hypothetical protein [Bacteroidales bacterium]
MKKVLSFVCGLAFAGCIVSCGGSNAGSSNSNGLEQKQEPAKQEQTQPAESQKPAEEAAKPDLTKKYICPNRDYSSDDENQVCPVCGMDGFTENN